MKLENVFKWVAGLSVFALGSLVTNAGQSLLSIQLGNDHSVSLSFPGEPTNDYDIQTTESLSQPWVSLGHAGIGGAGAFSFIDTNAPGLSQRFYRVIASPGTHPLATTTNATLAEDTIGVFSLDGLEPDNPAAVLTATILRAPTNGMLLQFDGTPIVTIPAMITDTARRVKFLAATNENGAPYASLDYSLQNSSGSNSTPQTVAITVTPVPDPPVGTTPRPLLLEDQPLLFQFTATDPDLTREGDTLHFFIDDTLTSGTLYQVGPDDLTRGARINDGDEITNAHHYVIIQMPTNTWGFNLDVFTYHVTDSFGLHTPIIPLTLDVAAAPDPPNAHAQRHTGANNDPSTEISCWSPTRIRLR